MSYVEFKRGIKDSYVNLENKSHNTFYYCEDTQELYLGDEFINKIKSTTKINETKVVKAWTNSDYTGRCYYVVTDIDNNWVASGDIVYYDENLEYPFAVAKTPIKNQFMVSTITLYYDMSLDYNETTKVRYVAKDDVLVTEKSVVEFVHNNHTQISGGDNTYLIINSADDKSRNNYNIFLGSIDKQGEARFDEFLATIKSIKTHLENNNYYNKENLTADELLRIQGLNFKQGDVVCYNAETGTPHNNDKLGHLIVFPWEEFVDEYEKKGYANIDEKYRYPVGLVLNPQRRTFVYSKLYTPNMMPYGGTGNVLHFARTSVSNGLDTKHAVEVFWNTPQQSGNKTMNFPAFYELSLQQSGTQMTEGKPPQNLFYLQRPYNYIPSIIELEDCFDNNLTIPHPDTPYFIPSNGRPLSRMEYMLGLKDGLVLANETTGDNFPTFIPDYNIFNGVSSTLASNVGKLNVGNRNTSIDCYDIRTEQFYLIIGLY